ncbi:16S rRNA (guanine(527)-N(7))-methyltransferase RsmG [Heyndrickxia oleronia]|uniref:16S rRNA (guanine(527)-N(7))-methyltransferase RsmG n=1 Tax=Heyndrickxia oleronia TaxID=38875 RepID=UPI0009040367|nr:16S rRNA (guanine(527)-N(7))-methyltransferase RsmG [Heyndrickxia oleronia]MCM3239621.1 16S rRNA (guanine(527)-N(7))-methyltransferase RsmG [Heyndrickxia oleronia]MCM3453906.1 16S rRNA (guanine(527)-N(7))-methyltransferase RsmG [Heyndrickxia oleronia]OJH19838.1 16S rRNA (guanine(527)-N(7))-methyltransferase RsmG [Bacillus obstructivus]
MNIEQFTKQLEEKGISLSSKQLQQFERYFELLVEWNEKMNLTAITEKNDVYLKHFFDSITASFYVNFNEPLKICDVGAGAGFPSIPLKICFPEIKVTIVDSLQKRISFLDNLSKELELKDTFFYHDRAETFAQKSEHREQYDLVTARAVARMSVLSELCIPLVKQNGLFVAMKAANANEELQAASKALKLLGAEVEAIHSFTLPYEESERNIIVINKNKQTPKKYPRKPGTPNKLPLE